jgi:predicted TPR repeat methyltransferase
MAYEMWGEALAPHSALSSAIEKFRAAHERGPHWADPIERWGEASAAQGQFQAAAQKYAEAVTYTPKWGALRLHLKGARPGSALTCQLPRDRTGE